ncbi:protein kinase [Spirillospora sp. NPDC047279]|uniref:WD40 repeat domain-containing serine/threonine protein kinase n=1 Tax=Spirillospora sp. NPDC047279 TaxID=3155478 RepID=UPI00340DD3F0
MELAGRYRLEKRLGRGGMGEVWRAIDADEGRAVAVKILRSTWLPGPDLERAKARFRREIEATSQVSHPAIAAMLDSGDHDERPFLVLELIDGEDLNEVLARRPDGLPVEVVIDLGARIADGLAAAHAAGIVHRDVKPSNVMVLPTGEIKICDFGVAHLEDATAGLSSSNTEVGTLAYMAPEQLDGGQVDGRADFYSLACTLFELLTGRVPFPGANPVTVIAMHLSAHPPNCRSLRSEIPESLDRLLLDMLGKKPDDRPTDVTRRLRECLPITVAATIRTPLDGLASAVAFSPDGTLLATGDRTGLIRLWDPVTAVCVADLPGHTGPVDSLAFSPDGTRLASGSRDRTARLWDPATRQAVAKLGHASLIRWIRRPVRHRGDPRRNEINSVAFTPDGQCLLTGSRGGIRFWHPVTGRSLRLRVQDISVRSMAFRPGTRRLATTSDYSSSVWSWHLNKAGGGMYSPRLHYGGVSQYPHSLGAPLRPLHAVAFGPHGSELASGGSEGRLRVWPMSPDRFPVDLDGHEGAVLAVDFSPDGRLLASGGRDGIIRLWDTASADQLVSLTGHTGDVTSITFSPDGAILASTCSGRGGLLWSLTIAPRRPPPGTERARPRPSMVEEHLAGEVLALGPNAFTDGFAVAREQCHEGDPEAALTSLRDLLPYFEESVGADHPASLSIRVCVAYWQAQAGDLAEAAATAEQLLPELEDALGPAHPTTQAARQGLKLWRL